MKKTVDRGAAIALFRHRFVPAPASEALASGAPAAGTPPIALLLLHGTGGDEDDLLPLGPLIAPGAALLSPRGPVLENGMPRFFRRFGEGVFDVEDLMRRTRDLGRFVRAARDAYGLGDSRLVAVGFSNGANIAASALLEDPPLLDAAILIRAMVPFEPENTPALAGKPVLLAAGRHDPIATPDQTDRLRAILESGGADVTVHWSPGGHALGRDDVAAARAWLNPARAGGGS